MYANDEKKYRKRIEQAFMIRNSNSRHFGYSESKKCTERPTSTLPLDHYWSIVGLLLCGYCDGPVQHSFGNMAGQ